MNSEGGYDIYYITVTHSYKWRKSYSIMARRGFLKQAQAMTLKNELKVFEKSHREANCLIELGITVQKATLTV